MSWIEKIQTQLVIQTGDGKEYRPHWLNATKSVEYNIAEFDFPNVEGTLVSRGTRKGTKYNLEIIFQGEEHLDTAEAFELSARDSRAWNITHPYWGRITVQPTALSFDNTSLNISKISGTVIETITQDYPKTSVVPQDKIAEDVEATDVLLGDSYANNAEPEVSDTTQMLSNMDVLYTEGAKYADTTIAEDYFNAFNTANAQILEVTSEPLAAIRAMQAVIAAPAHFKDSVQNRLTVLGTQMTALRTSLSTILTKNEKHLFQNNAGTLVTAMALTSATPQGSEYGNRNDVVAVIETVLQAYNQYLADLDSLQSANGGSPDSYIPDVNALIALNDVVNYTISSLFDIALNAKQERSIILEYDSNVILLTHRFYGLDDEDANIAEFMRNNNIGLKEILQIPRGKIIYYYV